MLLVLNLPLVGLWVRLLAIPKPWLYAGILTFATLGTIGANPSAFELGMLLAFGILGYGLRRFDYPIAPVVVGLILGPLAEQQLRRALAISQGDATVLVHSPVAIVLYLIAAVAVLLPVYLGCAARGRCSARWPPTRIEAGAIRLGVPAGNPSAPLPSCVQAVIVVSASTFAVRSAM